MYKSVFQRTPPKDLQAEQAVLGAILLKNDSLDKIVDIVSSRDFFDPRNRILYSFMFALASNNQKIDSITLSNILKSHRCLSRAGGFKYLAYLAESVPTAANVKYYANIVKRKSELRRAIRIGQKVENEAYSQQVPPTNVLQNAESLILKEDTGNKSGGLQPVSRLMKPTKEHINYLRKHHKRVTGLPTGFSNIDHITSGLQPGEFIVIAARPAMGKTTIALNIAQHVAINTNKAVAIFSLEMGAESLLDRMICAGGNIDHSHLRTGFLTKDESKRLIFPVQDLSESNLYIDDTAGINVTSILARARRLVKQGVNLGLIVVDYLQLVEGNAKDGRQQEVAQISRELKKLAKELNVPVIALSQLSRSVEQREDKRPVLSDIRESGAIEQDADIVAFLYRKDYYDQNSSTKKKSLQQINQEKLTKEKYGDPSLTEFIIAKNREGSRGSIKLIFLKAYNKFASITQQQLSRLENSKSK